MDARYKTHTVCRTSPLRAHHKQSQARNTTHGGTPRRPVSSCRLPNSEFKLEAASSVRPGPFFQTAREHKVAYGINHERRRAGGERDWRLDCGCRYRVRAPCCSSSAAIFSFLVNSASFSFSRSLTCCCSSSDCLFFSSSRSFRCCSSLDD